MTVSTDKAKEVFTGDGATTVFPVTFRIFKEDDIEVVVDSVTQMLNTDYTVENITDSSFDVDFGVAPVNNAEIVARRELDIVQETDYVESDPFPAESHEAALDLLTMINQQQKEELGRTLKASLAEDAIDDLPAPADRRGKLLQFTDDADANPEAVSVADANVVTVLDEDDFASDSATSPPSQQSTAVFIQSQISDSETFVTVTSFGATGDGVTDDTADIQSAIDSVEAAGGGVIFFPAGTYLISNTLTVDSSNVVLMGEGFESSKITAASPSFNMIDFDGAGSRLFKCGVEGLTIEAAANASANAMIRMDDVVDSYFDRLFLDGWKIGIDIVSCARCFFSKIVGSQAARTAGTGDHLFSLTGDAAISFPPSDIHFNDIQAVKANGVIADPVFATGWFVKGCDGLYIQNSHVSNAARVMDFNPDDTTNNDKITSVLVSNVYFDISHQINLSFRGTASDIYQGLQFSNCIFRQSQGAGAVLFFTTTTVIKDVTFSNCRFRGNTESAIHSNNSDIDGVTVSNCIFQGNNTSATAARADIFVRGDSWVINGNQFVEGNVAGVDLRATATNSIVNSNNFTNSTAGTFIADAGTGNKVLDNAGFNPVGVSSISVGASPFTYTAGSSPETVYTFGGTVSDFSLGATTIAVGPNNSITLSPHESVTVTYSSAPTMEKQVH